jgi:hypothetical protein
MLSYTSSLIDAYGHTFFLVRYSNKQVDIQIASYYWYLYNLLNY